MKKIGLLLAALACATVMLGSTVVLAGRATSSANLRERTTARDGGVGVNAENALFGQASGGGCRLAFDAWDEPWVPAAPDENDLVEIVSGVRMKKPCPGVVVGQFVTETGLTEEATGQGFLHAVMLAECVGTGGYTKPCTPGTQIYASPGEIWLDDDVQVETETRSMNAVWPSLKRGVWEFYVLMWGDGTNAAIGFRTFHVEAFSGGPAA